jgi:peptidoglycan L-alanyl-D-glutamate endopeptidase CwlK
MEVLRQGSSGSDVAKLQAQLQDLGFSPGPIDGNFGPATEAAVLAFQKSMELLADGIAGPRTQGALGLVSNTRLSSVIPRVTVPLVCQMFPHTPVAHIRTHLPAVCSALVAQELVDKPMVLAALATIRAETPGFVPLSEGQSRLNTSPGGHPFDLYDYRRDLGHTGDGDGAQFKGRGFIRLTGRVNYQRYSAALGLGTQLVDNPELANDPAVAAKLLSSFLKAKERAIKEALLEQDLRSARKLVNGGSHGLDHFVEAFTTGDALLTLASGSTPPHYQRWAPMEREHGRTPC